MHNTNYLHDILILLLASVGIVILFKQLRLSPALGYLVAGAMIGPFGFGILEGNESTQSIADLGIVFLLFAIGLELNFEKLIKMRKYVLGFGSLQVLVTTAIIAYIAHKFFGISKEAALIIGAAFSLSSTAIVLQIISENGEETTRVGRLAFSILLMQDLAVIPILVLLPALATTEINIVTALGSAFFDATIALIIIFAIGRLLLRPIYRLVAEAKSDVLFFSVTLIVILGSAHLSSYFGLSSAFGAFTAGLMVSETEYRYRVEEEILSIKSLLLGLFFVTIGMSFQLDFLLSSLVEIILVALGLILIKSLVIIILCKIFRLPLAPSIHTGLLLSQGGEFAFVVFIMAVNQNFIAPNTAQFLATVVTVTMAITPLLASFGRKIKGQLYIMSVLRDNKIKREIGEISKHVIIIGFSKIGHVIAYALRKKGINYVVLESNHRVVRLEKRNGYNIYYGDPMNIDILRYIGIERSESVIVAMDDEIACIKITRFIHENFHGVVLATKSESMNNAERFKKVGANLVVSKNFETSLQLIRIALSSTGVAVKTIDKMVDSFRDPDSELIKEFVRDKEVVADKKGLEDI
ncbi:MAG: potassium transporter [Rickettsiales bacterium]|nr:potassium transporter [Rickettsiales bacterium]